MPRPRVSVPTEAIRIEDEVWQDAFALAQDVALRRSQGLYAVDGGRVEPVRLASSEPARTAATPSPPATTRPVAVAPRPAKAAGSTAAYPRVRVAAATSPPVAAAASAVAEAADVDVDAPASPTDSAGATRRTVTIRGYGAERNLPWPSASPRRPARPVYERAGFRPDRVALWAVLLGVLLVVVAVASAHS